MHAENDENYQRGYEWWLMTEAKKVGVWLCYVHLMTDCLFFCAEEPGYQVVCTALGFPFLGKFEAIWDALP